MSLQVFNLRREQAYLREPAHADDASFVATTTPISNNNNNSVAELLRILFADLSLGPVDHSAHTTPATQPGQSHPREPVEAGTKSWSGYTVDQRSEGGQKRVEEPGGGLRRRSLRGKSHGRGGKFEGGKARTLVKNDLGAQPTKGRRRVLLNPEDPRHEYYKNYPLQQIERDYYDDAPVGPAQRGPYFQQAVLEKIEVRR